MSDDPTKESILDLLSHLESQETRLAAVLLALKDKGLVADDELAPYLAQAGKSSDIKMRAARARVEHLFSRHEQAKPATEATARSGETERRSSGEGVSEQRSARDGENKQPSAENNPAAAPAPYAAQSTASREASGQKQETKQESGHSAEAESEAKVPGVQTAAARTSEQSSDAEKSEPTRARKASVPGEAGSRAKRETARKSNDKDKSAS